MNYVSERKVNMNTVISKEHLCFDALLEIILSRLDPLLGFNQIDLAELFGITIPPGTQTSIKNVKYSNDITECGTNICIRDINQFFQKNSIQLKLSYIPSNCFDEISIGEILTKNNRKAFIVFAFCYGLLYNEPQNNDVGHVALFEGIDIKSDTIEIYDPGPRNYGSKTVKVDDMVYAIKRRGGIYLFEKV